MLDLIDKRFRYTLSGNDLIEKIAVSSMNMSMNEKPMFWE